MDYKIHVWIASHIQSAQRFEWFKETIRSLLNQTDLIDKIFISYSKENYICDDIEKIFIDEKIFFMKHDMRCTQFEHLRHIHNHVRELEQNIFVLFCDDDDMYDKYELIS